LQEAPYAFASTYESALQRSRASWSEQADHTAQGSDRATFIAFADDAPVGIAALYRQPETAGLGEIVQVWIAPEYRGTGLTSTLLDTVFRWAAENGFRTILATIRKDNSRALGFYRRYGFHFLDHVSLDHTGEVVMEKEISAPT